MTQHHPPQSTSQPDTPANEPRQVAERIWKFVLPIPFPLKTVNVYALVGETGWTLIDTGMGTPEARAAFAQGLERAGLALQDLQAIVLTHHHPDHIGLSGELQEQSGAPVYMHALDKAAILVHDANSMPSRFGRVSHFLTKHGLPHTELWFTRVERNTIQHIIRVPPQVAIQTVEDGQELELSGERYTVTWTPGHSDGQICLYRPADQVFLAADHVLPRITPNIGLYSESDRQNPLEDYLQSLNKVAQFPASLVLPGHGEPFQDLAGRTAEIEQHHHEREQQIFQLLEPAPQHATWLADKLFGNRLKSDEARRMAVAEVVAHLEYMRYNSLLDREENEAGVFLYKPIKQA